MSLILDALRKSERVRHQSLTGQLSAGETPAGPGRLPVPWVTLIAAILVVNALLLFFFWPRTAPAPAPTVNAPALPQSYRPSVRPLAQETDDVVTPQTPARSSAPAAAPQVLSAQPAPSVQIAPAAANTASLQTFDGLPLELRSALPALHMDVHGYATRPAERFVVINLKQYHIGDSVAEGLTLKDIVPQGAVLDYRGTVFLLPAS